jgi:hypothetical protein
MLGTNFRTGIHKHLFLAVGAILTHNPNGKFDKLVMYAFGLLNLVEKNYIIT